MLSKQDIRQEVLSRREQLSPENVRERSTLILQKVTDYLKTLTYSSAGLYISIRNEADILPLADDLWNRNITTYLPVVTDQGLVFCSYSSNSRFRNGCYNIPEPELKQEPHTSSVPDIMIIPCVACDMNRYRIGYGKGYYDRYLSSDNITCAIGVCYDFQLYKNIPHEKHDYKLDAVVTEQHVID